MEKLGVTNVFGVEGTAAPATTKELYYKRKEIEKKEKEFVKHMIDNKMSMESLGPTSGIALEYQAGVTENKATEMTRETPEDERSLFSIDRESWYPGKWFDFFGDKTEGAFTGWPELKPTKTSYVPQYDLPPSIIGKKDFKANVPYYQGLTPFKGDTLTLPKLKESAVVKDYTPRTYQSIKESKRPSQLETLAQKKERFRRMMLEPGMLGTQDKFAGGGMVGIRRPSAIAPTGGPMHQGLRSLYNNVKKS